MISQKIVISFSAKSANSFFTKIGMGMLRKRPVNLLFTRRIRMFTQPFTETVHAMPSKSPSAKMDDCRYAQKRMPPHRASC